MGNRRLPKAFKYKLKKEIQSLLDKEAIKAHCNIIYNKMYIFCEYI